MWKHRYVLSSIVLALLYISATAVYCSQDAVVTVADDRCSSAYGGGGTVSLDGMWASDRFDCIGRYVTAMWRSVYTSTTLFNVMNCNITNYTARNTVFETQFTNSYIDSVYMFAETGTFAQVTVIDSQIDHLVNYGNNTRIELSGNGTIGHVENYGSCYVTGTMRPIHIVEACARTHTKSPTRERSSTHSSTVTSASIESPSRTVTNSLSIFTMTKSSSRSRSLFPSQTTTLQSRSRSESVSAGSETITSSSTTTRSTKSSPVDSVTGTGSITSKTLSTSITIISEPTNTASIFTASRSISSSWSRELSVSYSQVYVTSLTRRSSLDLPRTSSTSNSFSRTVIRMAYMAPAPIAVIPVQVTIVSYTSSRIASIVSPVASSQTARAGAALKMILCEGSDEVPSYYDYPIQLYRTYPAVLVGTALFLLCLQIVTHISLAIEKPSIFVAYPATILTLFYAPICARDIVLHIGVSGDEARNPWIIVAAVIFIVVLAYPTWLILYSYSKLQNELKGASATGVESGYSEWFIASKKITHFKRVFALYLNGSRDLNATMSRSVVIVEMWIGIVSGIAESIAIELELCLHFTYMLAAISLGYALFLILYRPYHGYFETFSSIGKSTAICIISAASVASVNGYNFAETAESIMSALSIYLFVEVIVSLGLYCWEKNVEKPRRVDGTDHEAIEPPEQQHFELHLLEGSESSEHVELNTYTDTYLEKESSLEIDDML